MTNNKEKLDKFIHAVNEEIDSKIKAINDDAQKEKKEILDIAEIEANEAAEKYYNINSQKNSNQFVQEISNAELTAKKAVIQHRTKLVDELFSSVEQRLKEYRNSSKYADILVKKLLLMNISDDIEIQLCEEDVKYADLLKKALPSYSVTVSGSDRIKLGGMSVYIPSKGVIIDKTFDLALEENKQNFISSNSFAK